MTLISSRTVSGDPTLGELVAAEKELQATKQVGRCLDCMYFAAEPGSAGTPVPDGWGLCTAAHANVTLPTKGMFIDVTAGRRDAEPEGRLIVAPNHGCLEYRAKGGGA